MNPSSSFKATNIIAAGTSNVINSRSSVLHTVTINSTFTGTVKLYDAAGTANIGTGTLFATIGTPSITPQTLIYDATLKNGLCVVATGTPEVTVNAT